jgi:hypothetical protein
MKRFALIAAIFLAVSGVAVAQQDMGNVSAAGATYTTGVVEANAVDSITIREDDGRVLTFLIDGKTVGALGHSAGSRVRIDFHRNELDQGVADEIQGVSSGNEMAAVAEAKVVTEPVLPSGPPIEEETQVAVAEPEPEPVVIETAPEPAYTEPLPATGSRLFELGLLGLLALSAATVIRFAR